LDDQIENSTVIKVKDPKKIKWPKISQFSVNTTIKGNLGKSKESLQEKFLLITFRKVEDKENADLDITIGTLKIDLRDFLATSKDEIFFNAKNKKNSTGRPRNFQKNNNLPRLL